MYFFGQVGNCTVKYPSSHSCLLFTWLSASDKSSEQHKTHSHWCQRCRAQTGESCFTHRQIWVQHLTAALAAPNWLSRLSPSNPSTTPTFSTSNRPKLHRQTNKFILNQHRNSIQHVFFRHSSRQQHGGQQTLDWRSVLPRPHQQWDQPSSEH